jgi:hypothetical protein
MADVKGKFITLCGVLMGYQQDALQEANHYLQEKLGKTHLELEPEDWYSTEVFDYFMNTFAKYSEVPAYSYIVLGKRIYPKIKFTTGLPEHLKTPLDFIKFEAEGFLANHRGDDVIPREFIKAEEGEVIVKAPAPGYNSKLYEGVFLGILQMCEIQTGKVVQTEKDVFKITW